MDFYAIGGAAMRGVVLLIFAWLMVLVIRALRWLWRRITGVTISSVAETTGVVAGKANGRHAASPAGSRRDSRRPRTDGSHTEGQHATGSFFVAANSPEVCRLVT